MKGLVMSSGRKYPEELKQRAIRLVGEAREQDEGLSQHGAVVRIAKLVGVHCRSQQSLDHHNQQENIMHENIAGIAHTKTRSPSESTLPQESS